MQSSSIIWIITRRNNDTNVQSASSGQGAARISWRDGCYQRGKEAAYFRAFSIHFLTSGEHGRWLFLEEKATWLLSLCKEQNRKCCSAPRSRASSIAMRESRLICRCGCLMRWEPTTAFGMRCRWATICGRHRIRSGPRLNGLILRLERLGNAAVSVRRRRVIFCIRERKDPGRGGGVS